MTPNPEKLNVLWTSPDKQVAERMVFMYTLNARLKDWWKEVSLIIWGPSAKLLAENPDLQEKLEEMKAAGVELLACKACADSFGVSEKLESLGVTVKYMGDPLTKILKAKETLISV